MIAPDEQRDGILPNNCARQRVRLRETSWKQLLETTLRASGITEIRPEDNRQKTTDRWLSSLLELQEAAGWIQPSFATVGTAVTRRPPQQSIAVRVYNPSRMADHRWARLSLFCRRAIFETHTKTCVGRSDHFAAILNRTSICAVVTGPNLICSKCGEGEPDKVVWGEEIAEAWLWF